MASNNQQPDYMALLSSLTTQDIVQFFASIPGQGACPICSSQLIAFTAMSRKSGDIQQSTDKPATVKKRVHDTGGGEAPIYLPFIPACCDTCGFMAEFSAAPILEWKAGRHGA
jgi:hypothetical protein